MIRALVDSLHYLDSNNNNNIKNKKQNISFLRYFIPSLSKPKISFPTELVLPDSISCLCLNSFCLACPLPLSSSACVRTPNSVDFPASTFPTTATRISRKSAKPHLKRRKGHFVKFACLIQELSDEILGDDSALILPLAQLHATAVQSSCKSLKSGNGSFELVLLKALFSAILGSANLYCMCMRFHLIRQILTMFKMSQL